MHKNKMRIKLAVINMSLGDRALQYYYRDGVGGKEAVVNGNLLILL
jgi:hypothetical protein